MAGEYSQEASISTKTKDVLDENGVDASAIRSAAPNELIISIGNPSDTDFSITDVKSVKVELSTDSKAAVSIVEKAIEDAIVTDNIATFSADGSIDLVDYIKADEIKMKVTVTTGTDVSKDTELCFELKNNMKIGLPQ